MQQPAKSMWCYCEAFKGTRVTIAMVNPATLTEMPHEVRASIRQFLSQGKHLP